MELKTGYGLTADGELRELEAARSLRDAAAQTCTVTFLPCHAIPMGIDRDAWMDTVVTELLPAAAAIGIDAVDIYVEDIAFGTDDLERLAMAAPGVPLRVHGDQLSDTGSAAAAARLGARSVDHLNHTSPDGVAALAASETVAVLLPSSTAFLGLQPAPAAALRAAGVPVAVATDCNPGTSPVASMPRRSPRPPPCTGSPTGGPDRRDAQRRPRTRAGRPSRDDRTGQARRSPAARRTPVRPGPLSPGTRPGADDRRRRLGRRVPLTGATRRTLGRAEGGTRAAHAARRAAARSCTARTAGSVARAARGPKTASTRT